MFQGYTGAPWCKHGAGADNSCSELYNKARANVPEVGNIRKATSESRHPRDSRITFTLGLPRLFILEPLSWASKSLLFWTVGAGMCRSSAKLGEWGRRGGERFLQTPAEVDYGRRRVEDWKGHFLRADWEAASPSLLSAIKNAVS